MVVQRLNKVLGSLCRLVCGCAVCASTACAGNDQATAAGATAQAGATMTSGLSHAGGGAGMPGAAIATAGRAGGSGSTRPTMAPDVLAEAGRGGAGVMASAGHAAATAGGQGAAGQAARAGAGGQASAGRAAAAGEGAAANSGTCEFPDPPSDVAGWVDESWNAQLGMNIKTRQAWNLDNVMLNKGSLNLCVRWGASMPVPASVRDNLAATTERWFNDWFKGLAGYGCFPYGAGIQVKVTGWAVKPGRESLLMGVDPAIPVYTEVDGEGEPKCPDACSSFVHWDHKFDACKGGDANHSDYWLWFDDTLPGSGGAAAVGGDWGLRMPVSTFLDAFEAKSFHITEHEMGHGFGFQDYYDWNGAKPKGGSIMIVGSTDSDAPTDADLWLLKRTWKEMKTLRKW